MQEVLLFAAVAVMFSFGWFLMGKLDGFLEANGHGQKLQRSSGGSTLWLGVCNPMVAENMTDVLEQYSQLYPEMSVRVFCEPEEELLKGFSAGKFDVVFLPKSAQIPAPEKKSTFSA